MKTEKPFKCIPSERKKRVLPFDQATNQPSMNPMRYLWLSVFGSNIWQRTMPYTTAHNIQMKATKFLDILSYSSDEYRTYINKHQVFILLFWRMLSNSCMKYILVAALALSYRLTIIPLYLALKRALFSSNTHSIRPPAVHS